MESKDLFSSQSKAYAAFRPTYPEELFSFIYKRVQNFGSAWDCATGNGQAARELAKKFSEVYATDISQQQLDEGFQANNIHYSVSPAERSDFAAGSFDLITVGQALHWFNIPEFYKEVTRVGKNGSTIAVWGYSLLSIEPAIDDHFNRFYFEKVGRYWDAARKIVEDEYASVPFPFNNTQEAKFSIKLSWTREDLAGYLTSWSATQKYIRENQHSPVPEFVQSIKTLWKDTEIKDVRFPVFVKVGTI
jgi:hypothetical protein